MQRGASRVRLARDGRAATHGARARHQHHAKSHRSSTSGSSRPAAQRRSRVLLHRECSIARGIRDGRARRVARGARARRARRRGGRLRADERRRLGRVVPPRVQVRVHHRGERRARSRGPRDVPLCAFRRREQRRRRRTTHFVAGAAPPRTFEPNEHGYTIMAYSKALSPLSAGRWRLSALADVPFASFEETPAGRPRRSRVRTRPTTRTSCAGFASPSPRERCWRFTSRRTFRPGSR